MSAANPQVNIIAPHEKNENFGFSSLPPNTMFPYLERAINKEIRKKPKPIIR